MFEKITNDNVLLFALKHYDNPQCEGEKEFYDDMKRFKYIKRLLKKYKVDGIVKERLLLNHIIICLLYTSPSPRDLSTSRMPSSA